MKFAVDFIFIYLFIYCGKRFCRGGPNKKAPAEIRSPKSNRKGREIEETEMLTKTLISGFGLAFRSRMSSSMILNKTQFNYNLFSGLIVSPIINKQLGIWNPKSFITKANYTDNNNITNNPGAIDSPLMQSMQLKVSFP